MPKLPRGRFEQTFSRPIHDKYSYIWIFLQDCSQDNLLSNGAPKQRSHEGLTFNDVTLQCTLFSLIVSYPVTAITRRICTVKRLFHEIIFSRSDLNWKRVFQSLCRTPLILEMSHSSSMNDACKEPFQTFLLK